MSEKKKRRSQKVKRAYERLAYGGICDAVRLLFAEDTQPQNLEKMDLYNVAEINRPSKGGMQIKFFDRMKALESLERMELEKEEKPSFYEALTASVRVLQREN